MRLSLLFLLLFAGFTACAQRACQTAEYTEMILRTDAVAASRIYAAATFVQQNPAHARTNGDAQRNAQASVIRIPVVVHILYHNNAENITGDQVRAQIAALNRDFRRMNADTTNTPARFRGVAADVAIEFVLATTDITGAATTGILRKYTPVTEWTANDAIKWSSKGGDDAWNSESYLNIWIGNLRRLSGYASVPGSLPENDGVVIHYGEFGSAGPVSPTGMSRTTVHEVGHWLGLKHIWGDKYCGDDGIDDTPRQGNYTTGCPSGFRSSCSNGEMGDMYMNYMDYTSDACVNMFTVGQKDQMRAYLLPGAARYGLVQSHGLRLPESLQKDPETLTSMGSSLRAFPNPARSVININTTGTAWNGKSVGIYNASGTLVQTICIIDNNQQVWLDGLPAGTYFIQGTGEAKRVVVKFVKL